MAKKKTTESGDSDVSFEYAMIAVQAFTDFMGAWQEAESEGQTHEPFVKLTQRMAEIYEGSTVLLAELGE